MIRKADKNDIMAMFTISQSSFELPWSLASFEAEFLKEFSQTYVYLNNNKVIAFLTVWIIQNEGEIVNLAVHPAFRGRGIASGLLEYVFQKYRIVKKWNLEVDQTNINARRLYEKKGFNKTRIINNYYGQQKNAIQMNKGGDNVKI